MRHIYGIAPSGKIIYSSNNLSSSASWLRLYIDAYNVPAIQCSPDSLLNTKRRGKLEEQIKYRHRPADAFRVKDLLSEKRRVEEKLARVNNDLVAIGRDHYYAANSI
jgi:hypothetical protein